MSENLKQLQGKLGEQSACDYLRSQGLRLVEENYRCKQGEIDLIMEDEKYLVFIEVRLRNREDYGHVLESINRSKQRKVIRAATDYLLKTNRYDKVDCRFDVVAIDSNQKLTWIKDAFWA